MRIWKLTPADPAAPIWKLCNPDPIFVRANSEAEARHLAELATVKFLPAQPGQPIPINPWSAHQKITFPQQPAPTLCEDVTDQTNEYPADGPLYG